MIKGSGVDIINTCTSKSDIMCTFNSPGVGVVMRIYLDIIEATLDVPIGASAMKEEIWKM